MFGNSDRIAELQREVRMLKQENEKIKKYLTKKAEESGEIRHSLFSSESLF